VVSMGSLDGSGKGADRKTYSLELCGGTHVARTGDIGAFALLSESASSSGVRRIEALTGQAALDHLRAQDARLAEVAVALKTHPGDVLERVKALQDERRSLANEVAQLRSELAITRASDDLEPKVDRIGVQFAAAKLRDIPASKLRNLIDITLAKMSSGFVILAAANDGSNSIAVGVTSELSTKLDATKIVKAIVEHLGGKGGGGRKDFAQGGAPSLIDFDFAVEQARKEVVDPALGFNGE
jgi:alanyl-tRNA synthetase